jgi:predicted  nucleic acid-binding Zn-ribbon protein
VKDAGPHYEWALDTFEARIARARELSREATDAGDREELEDEALALAERHAQLISNVRTAQMNALGYAQLTGQGVLVAQGNGGVR